MGSGTTVAAVHRSGSRDEEVEEKGEGAQKKEISIAGSITKKPTTKAERRALQVQKKSSKDGELDLPRVLFRRLKGRPRQKGR